VQATRTKYLGIFGPQSLIADHAIVPRLAAEDASDACAMYRGLLFRQRDEQTLAEGSIGRPYALRLRARIVMNLKQKWHTTETEI
tara:strand:- start:339 stop:593 length:255 start_codon:yes stop_codon:yes gene_type:complete